MLNDAAPHFHLMGVCREHGSNDLDLFDTKEEINEALNNSVSRIKADQEGAIVVENGRSPETVEFILTRDGKTHNMFVTWRLCDLPQEICRMRQVLEGLRMAAIEAFVQDEEVPIDPVAPIITDEDQASILNNLDSFFKNPPQV